MITEEARQQIIKLQNQLYKNWVGDIELDADEHYEALDVAIEALDKQIPRKPSEQTEEQKKYDTERCPVCQQIIRASEYKSDYCEKCGQKILWEEEE